MIQRYLKILTLIIIFLGGYYFFTYQAFASKSDSKEPQEFRARLGTILYHTDTPGTAYHTYCYYPTSKVSYEHKSGEYIIKRVNSYQDCKGWLGTAIYKEGWWVSEKEKIWWDNDYYNDNIANSTTISKSDIN